MSNTDQPATQDPFAIAEEWYYGLLGREMDVRGSGDNKGHLRHFIKLQQKPGSLALAGQPIDLQVFSRATECELRINRGSGEVISWYLDFLAQNGNRDMPETEALQLASTTANLPNGAVLESQGYETMSGRTFFRARWSHTEQDLPVEGDYIEVLVNGRYRKVFSLNKVWREPNLSNQSRVR